MNLIDEDDLRMSIQYKIDDRWDYFMSYFNINTRTGGKFSEYLIVWTLLPMKVDNIIVHDVFTLQDALSELITEHLKNSSLSYEVMNFEISGGASINKKIFITFKAERNK